MQWKYFPRYWPFVRGIHRSPVNSPHKGQWRGALIFSLICAWINGWVNNREAGDLRRHHAHYDVIVMSYLAGDNWFSDAPGLLIFTLSYHPPLNTWRNNNVVITSKRRHFDVITSKWCRLYIITTSLLLNVSVRIDRFEIMHRVCQPYSHAL